jgi:hypothetical protein
MVGPILPETGAGYHLYIVEGAAPVDHDQAADFAEALDRTLAACNVDYAEHRRGGFGMAKPQARFLPPGSFANWMKARGKLGGQNKVPRVIADTEKFKAIVEALSKS